MDSEKIIEARLRQEIRKRGGYALKWVSPGTNGVPDRIVLMPMAKAWFLELKSTGQNLDPLQKVWRRKLIELGFQHRVIDTLELLNKFLDEVDSTQLSDNSA